MITSLSNPQIKQIRKLRDRKERQESGLFAIEGLRIVTEAVQLNAKIDVIIYAPELLSSEIGQQVVANETRRGGPLLEVSAEVFKSIALKDNPQGLAAVVQQEWHDLSEITLGQGDLWVALDAVADPGNLGTILRTHDGVGGRGVILLDQSTDAYDPTAIRASMGAVFSQRLVRASLPEFATWKQLTGCPLVGTSGEAQADYHTFSYPDPMVLLMGSERQGLQPKHLELCDALVRIPMVGRSDSLNLAVATAITLYEIFNHRRDQHDRSN